MDWVGQGQYFLATHFASQNTASNSAEKYAQQENPKRIRDFLKKIGSNFLIAERTLSFPLKNAWILAEKYHAEAQRAEATSYDFAKSVIWRKGRDSFSLSSSSVSSAPSLGSRCFLANSLVAQRSALLIPSQRTQVRCSLLAYNKKRQKRFLLMRCLLDKVRNYFEQNPND